MKTRNDRPRNRRVIFYKSHGKFTGPWAGLTFSRKEITEMRNDGSLAEISNYVLHSPIQIRRRVGR